MDQSLAARHGNRLAVLGAQRRPAAELSLDKLVCLLARQLAPVPRLKSRRQQRQRPLLGLLGRCLHRRPRRRLPVAGGHHIEEALPDGLVVGWAEASDGGRLCEGGRLDEGGGARRLTHLDEGGGATLVVRRGRHEVGDHVGVRQAVGVHRRQATRSLELDGEVARVDFVPHLPELEEGALPVEALHVRVTRELHQEGLDSHLLRIGAHAARQVCDVLLVGLLAPFGHKEGREAAEHLKRLAHRAVDGIRTVEEHEPQEKPKLALVVAPHAREQHVCEALGDHKDEEDHPKREPLPVVVSSGSLDRAHREDETSDAGEQQPTPLCRVAEALGLPNAVRPRVWLRAFFPVLEGVAECADMLGRHVGHALPLFEAGAHLALGELVLAHVGGLAAHRLVRELARHLAELVELRAEAGRDAREARGVGHRARDLLTRVDALADAEAHAATVHAATVLHIVDLQLLHHDADQLVAELTAGVLATAGYDRNAQARDVLDVLDLAGEAERERHQHPWRRQRDAHC
mmetsp:Transcript_40860/g.119303  ORF Transcript_40860/g.119303 Transcript_40860/m.119303 type:complete len:518 (-) Transcript_40860:8-1561(-)